MAFSSGEWLGAFFFPSLPVADTVHNSRVLCSEVVSYTRFGLHTADFAATSVLLLQNYSRPRLRLPTDCPAFRTVLLQRRTAAATARAATATTIEELRSELLLRFRLCGLAAVEGEDTRLHKHTRSHPTTP